MRRLFSIRLALIMVGLCLPQAASAEWKTVCDDKRCQLYERIARPSDNQLLAQLFFQKVPKAAEKELKDTIKPNSVYGALMLPLGLHIPSGVKIAIDDKLSFDAELISCKPKEGCRAIFFAQKATIDAMKRGAKFVVEVVDSDSGRRINFTFALSGFTQSFDEFDQKAF